MDSARARTQRRTGRKRTRAHAEARAERRRNSAEKIPATGAPAVGGDWAGGVGPEPVAASFAQRIDALHGETGQILHAISPSGRQFRM
ncbi:MAG TPA: hypothetical protein VE077_11905 [Candidatus Methylomirabilis sp.]|nr:hypothetical protein [Candidatus Methylomirabilis sp.]